MLRIKLIRTGKKHAPSFRVAVGPKTKVIEVLGSYNPQLNPPSFQINKERLDYWLKNGAKLTEAVEKLIQGKYEFRSYVPKPPESEEEEASEEQEQAETKAERQEPDR